MTYDVMGRGALDYFPCRYGTSRLLFRGPKQRLEMPYIAFIGGTETYGRFIERPFATLVQDDIGTTCVNLGCMNAGIDVFAQDPFVPGAAAAARVTVVQVMGAHNMSNRFYAVHPRRNDRFVAPSDLLKTIFREIDFSEFHFNKHLLTVLHRTSPERFDMVRRELQSAWVARMRLLMGQMRGKTILLWFAPIAPPDGGLQGPAISDEPVFITRAMIQQVAPYVSEVVEVVHPRQPSGEGTQGMIFSPLEAHAAAALPGVQAHEEVAAALARAINAML